MIDANKFAGWVSAEARAAFRAGEPSPPADADIEVLRQHYNAFNERLLSAALSAFEVEIEPTTIAGVSVNRVNPAGGVLNGRTLICLHGGAFMWGSGAGALLEAVPIAAETGSQVIAVNYRLAPEHIYPAAVEDVLGVYAEVTALCSPPSVGMYGCSAGAVLTSQVVARLAHDGTPTPGAIALLHGAGIDFDGDLAEVAPTFALHPGDDPTPTAAQLPYFAETSFTDPLVMPAAHPSTLERFPPTLLITGTRDFAASACSIMHRRLLGAGIDARLVLFDGMWHAHHILVDLPESRETYGLMRKFFEEHLS